MAQPVIQTSFHAGEWAPALHARVDLAKYKAGAALMRNFFVDYRGGASTRPGTQYVLQCWNSEHDVRLIPFQASIDVTYVLEFGDFYIRMYNNGAPVLRSGLPITNITNTNPAVVSVANTTYLDGDWVFITGVGGMTEVNGNYYIIVNRTAASIELANLDNSPVDATAYGVYTSNGSTNRIFTIGSPYPGTQEALSKIKFAQNVDTMVICHPDYPPYVLQLFSAANWTLTPITFGSTATTPSGQAAASTLGAGTVHYSYVVTSVDIGGQESTPSTPAILTNLLDLRTVAGSNTITWSAATGAISYNVYKAELRYGAAVPAGAAFGYIGTATATTFIDSNIDADFSRTPPVAQNPFSGTGVVSYTVTIPGTYTNVPGVTVAAPPTGTTATAVAELGVTGTPTVGAGGTGYAVNDTIELGNGVVVVVNTVAAGVITAFKAITVSPSDDGSITSGTVPTNPVSQVTTSGSGTGATVNLVWGVNAVVKVTSGVGYVGVPAVTFSIGIGAATAVLGAATDLYPTVPGFFQQRLVLAALAGNPQAFFMSQPGSSYNFNISNPIEPDDAISASLVSGQLNTIQSMVSMPSGLIFLTDRAAWQVDGGSQGAGVTPSNIVANSHSYNGANLIPPIVANFDILFVQSKGSIVRDLTYNLYSNIYTGTDISVLSSQLFYGYNMHEWAYAEEPFKVVWVVRDDGSLLSLTFVKEQELIGWAHSDTDGLFISICSVTEQVDVGSVDAIYTVVRRNINGHSLAYVERFAERAFFAGAEDAWCVDSGLSYVGPPATTFRGASHLAGQTCTGLADGAIITDFVMPADGTFTLAEPVTKLVVGLAYTCQLQTLALDTGEPTIQGKRKKIAAVTVRVENSLGLTIGQDFGTVVPMKDLVLGNVGSATNEVVTNLVTGDARTIIDPSWTEPGQYCFQQTVPYPVTILGVIPEITVGDTVK